LVRGRSLRAPDGGYEIVMVPRSADAGVVEIWTPDTVSPRLEHTAHAYHSLRSATMGSTRVARRAGSQLASVAAAASRTTTPARVTGSTGVTPKSRPVTSLAAASAAAMPITSPASISTALWRTMS